MARTDSALALLLLLSSGPAAGAQADSSLTARAESARSASAVRQDPEAATVQAAIDSGLRFLLGAQQRSGAIGEKFPVAITSLAGLAVLGAGYHYREEKWSEDEKLGRELSGLLGNALSFILKSSDEKGYFSDEKSRMHGHCYAVLFLTQIYGELQPAGKLSEKVKRAIQDGLEVIRKSQSTEGGWYYAPVSTGEDEASITICALQALRAANGIGFLVPRDNVERAVSYVERCQTNDGSFRYSFSGRDNHTSYALTVAAVSALHAAGVYDAPEIAKGLDFARRRLAERPGEPMKVAEREFFFYANLYAAQAFWQAGGELWASWYPQARRHLLQRQRRDDGSWSDDAYGDDFGTAMAVLILEVPLNYLPIFQR